METKKFTDLTDNELRRLLNEIDQLDVETIQPLSDNEVAEFEKSYKPIIFSPEREERHRKQLEDLRQEWLSDVDPLKGIFSRVAELNLSREEFAHKLHIHLDVLFKVDLHLVKNVPDRFARRLAYELEVDIRSLYLYLAQEARELDQMAASSKGKPARSNMQTWEEAIKASGMSDEEKDFWLEKRD